MCVHTTEVLYSDYGRSKRLSFRHSPDATPNFCPPKIQGRSQGFQSGGYWGPKGRKRGGVLRRGKPASFSTFWVLWMASPVNRIRCRDVFSSLSFIYFAHYRIRLTVIIPPLGQSRCSLIGHTCSSCTVWFGQYAWLDVHSETETPADKIRCVGSDAILQPLPRVVAVVPRTLESQISRSSGRKVNNWPNRPLIYYFPSIALTNDLDRQSNSSDREWDGLHTLQSSSQLCDDEHIWKLLHNKVPDQISGVSDCSCTPIYTQWTIKNVTFYFSL